MLGGGGISKSIESSYYEMPDNVKDYLRNGGNPNNIKMKFDVNLDIDVDAPTKVEKTKKKADKYLKTVRLNTVGQRMKTENLSLH